MSSNPIRVAMSALGERIYAGRPTKDGRSFKEPRYDVTSDVLAAIRDKVGVGNEIEVGLAGTGVEFRIAVLAPDTLYTPRAITPTIPPGMKLVPVEPTEAMIHAVWKATLGGSLLSAERAARAMLAAVPDEAGEAGK